MVANDKPLDQMPAHPFVIIDQFYLSYEVKYIEKVLVFVVLNKTLVICDGSCNALLIFSGTLYFATTTLDIYIYYKLILTH